MSEIVPLSSDSIAEALTALPGWTFEGDRLTKRFLFSSFREATSFVVRLAFESEDLNHHPELNWVYNRVDVALATHDAGNRVTERDIALARSIEHFSWI